MPNIILLDEETKIFIEILRTLRDKDQRESLLPIHELFFEPEIF